MDAISNIEALIVELQSLEVRELALLFVFYGTQLAALLFAARSGLVIAGRLLGLYHPKFYRRWPRTGMRSIIRIWLALTRWQEIVFRMGKRSTAGFASVASMLTNLFKPGLIHVGRAWGFGLGLLQPVGINVSRHLFAFAITGGGKTTALVTIIATWSGSCFLIDPKGQITHALKNHDDRDWSVIEPYGKDSAGFNPFDCLKEAIRRSGDPETAVLWALRISEALIVTPAGSRTPFFTDTARGFLAALILHVLTSHPEPDHHLPFARRTMVDGYRVISDDGIEIETNEEERHELLYRAMASNPAFGGMISGGVAAMRNASGETAGNVRATLLEQTKWLDIPSVARVLTHTSLPLSHLKTKDDCVVAFVAPVLSTREELAPFCRLLTNMLGYVFQDELVKKGQCLTVIDELPSQGHNAALEIMIPVARSQGLTVLGISQNIELLRMAYPKSYNIFIGEADAVMWLGINHKETSEYLSSLLGKKTLIEIDRYSGNKSYREVNVLSDEQTRRFLAPDSGNLIVTRAGSRALRLKNEPYFNALPVWAYAPDPDHKEALLRRLARRLFDNK